MRVTKKFHRVWIPLWLLAFVVIFFLPIRIYNDESKLTEADKRRNAERCIENARILGESFLEGKALQYLDWCEAKEAERDILGYAANTRYWVLSFAAFFVFAPYLAVGTINLVDGLVNDPDPMEEQLEDVLRGKNDSNRGGTKTQDPMA